MTRYSSQATIPTGTGFRHITSSTEDDTAKLVTNSDVDTDAAIIESKISFNTSSGHTHDGSNSKTVVIPSNTNITSISFIIDGGGSAITTGMKGYLEIPFGCTINRATLMADQTGSIVVNIYKDVYANFPPDVSDKITSSSPPTISSSNKSQDSTLTGWTTSITAGDILGFNVDSCSTITRITLSLKVTKT